jgi:tryptophan-rich sensory protein
LPSVKLNRLHAGIVVFLLLAWISLLVTVALAQRSTTAACSWRLAIPNRA